MGHNTEARQCMKKAIRLGITEIGLRMIEKEIGSVIKVEQAME